jgi:hypothetical protein
VAKDTSGAVLPGVTVEASSPALIEKVRTVATDGEGRFNIVDLPPGAPVVDTQDVRKQLGGGGSFHGKRGTKGSFNGMGVENRSGNSSYQRFWMRGSSRSAGS